MINNRHIIKKQLLQIEVQGQENAYKTQQQLGRIFKERLLPIISKALDKYSPPNVIHRIDKLVIDLGEVKLEALENDLEQAFRRYFEPLLLKELKKAELDSAYYSSAPKHSHQSTSLGTSAQQFEEFSQKKKLLPDGATPLQMREKAQRTSFSIQSATELLSYFLETGQLPWWAKASSNLIDEAMEQIIEQSPHWINRELRMLLKLETHRKRLINHISNELLNQLVKTLITNNRAHELNEIIPKILYGLEELEGRIQLSIPKLRYILWESVLTTLVNTPPNPINSFQHNFQTHLKPFTDLTSKDLTEILNQISRIFVVQKEESAFEQQAISTREQAFPLKNKLQNIVEEHVSESKMSPIENQEHLSFPPNQEKPLEKEHKTKLQHKSSLKNEDNDGKSPEIEKLPIDQQIEKQQPEEVQQTKEQYKEPTVSDSPLSSHLYPFNKKFNYSDEIYIDNAGLVILWVFFSPFFKQLGWLEDKRFKRRALQHRAVWMLQHLVDAQDAPPEYLLPLNKLLCGIPLDEVLEPQAPLDEKEQIHCRELLEAVIAHATVLGSISVEGFQQTFLQREGVLSHKKNMWALQVQKETFDILLSRLEWDYHIVKLPWMNLPIYVEW